MTLWSLDQPSLVLASKSVARRSLLAAAGIPLEVRPSELDERALERPEMAATDVALMLAQEKALAASRGLPGRIVIGADQVLALDGVRFSKPADRASARSQLQVLRGRTHLLLSAVAVVRDAEVRFAELATARLTMREFSDSFLDAYLDAAGRTVEESVGGYQLEGLGIHLFERVDGEHSTILGLPLLPLLDFLRREGLLTG